MKTIPSLLHRFSVGLLMCSLWFLITAGSMNPVQPSLPQQESVQPSATSPAGNRIKEMKSQVFSGLNRQKKQTDPEPKDSISRNSIIALGISLLGPVLGIISIFAVASAAWTSASAFILGIGILLGCLMLIIGFGLGIRTLIRIKKSGRKDQYIFSKRRAIVAIVPFIISVFIFLLRYITNIL